MAEMIAYCGLACHSCPIYLATREEDREERARMKAGIVKQCREHYGITYALEEITDCDGCKTEGKQVFSASRNCLIRQCARERKVENCAYCDEYACSKLEAISRTDPDARTRLDGIRHGSR
jgi:hypothetical protein